MNHRPYLLVVGFILLFTAAVSLSGCIINVNAAGIADLDHQQKQLTLDSQDLSRLIATTGAGAFTIEGVAGVTKISLVADIYTNKDNPAEISLTRSGDSATLNAGFATDNVSYGSSPYIDLTLHVPAQMLLDITDTSGALHISKMTADISIDDGSGELVITGGYNVSIIDGSGAIKISQISGNLSIRDGSGDINVSQVGENVTIHDGSGGIDLRDVQGSSLINDDSGDITATNLIGAVTITDGSGAIDVSQVQNTVSITDGSGNIKVYDTKGLTLDETGSGDVNFDKIDGPVSMK